MKYCCFFILAGKTTTDEELEEMLESGNPAIFTSDVCISGPVIPLLFCCFCYLESVSAHTYSCPYLFHSPEDYIRLSNN